MNWVRKFIDWCQRPDMIKDLNVKSHGWLSYAFLGVTLMSVIFIGVIYSLPAPTPPPAFPTYSSSSLNWEKTYDFGMTGHAISIKNTSDGDMIVLGTKSYDNSTYRNVQVCLFKLDPRGNIEWEQCFGGPYFDYPEDVVQAKDGGFVILAKTETELTFDAKSYPYILKTDPLGNKEWELYISATAIEATPEGGYILAGRIGSGESANISLIKLGGDGVIEWNSSFGEPNLINCPIKVQNTNDGGYIILGCSYKTFFDTEDPKFWVYKTDSFGSLEWQRAYGASVVGGLPQFNWNTLGSIRQTIDGGYVIVGTIGTLLENGYINPSIFLLKINPEGDVNWLKSFTSQGGTWGNDVQQTPDGGYIVAGGRGMDVNGSQGNIWIIKTDASGEAEWMKEYGGPYWDEVDALVPTTDGCYILAGSTSRLNFEWQALADYTDYWNADWTMLDFDAYLIKFPLNSSIPISIITATSSGGVPQLVPMLLLGASATITLTVGILSYRNKKSLGE